MKKFKGKETVDRHGRVVIASIATAALFAITSCAGTGTANEAVESAEAEPYEVRIGHASGISHAPVYVAYERGYFKEEGIDLDLEAFPSAGDMVAPLSTGDLDVGLGAPGAGLFNAVGRGLGVKLVADEGRLSNDSKFSSLMVRKSLVDSGEFESLADLEGRPVGLLAEGTSTTIWFDRALDSVGLERSDVQFNHLGAPDQAIALENGSIDAATVPEPYAAKIIDEDVAVRFALGSEFYPEQQLSVMIFGTTFAEETPEVAKDFLKAWLRGLEDVQGVLKDGRMVGEGSEEVVEIVSEHTGLEEHLIEKAYTMPVDPNGALNVEGLADDLETYRAQGLIEHEELTIEDVVDTSFVDAAAEKLDN